MFLSCRPFVVITSQETEVTSTSIRPVENVVLTTKGLQDRNNLLLDGRTVENKGKLILILYHFQHLFSENKRWSNYLILHVQ